MKKILVVGAGFAGAVIARELAESGKYQVDIIDRRDHIGGNAYDEVHKSTGCRYHKYGPHIFHTNDIRVFDYLSKFTKWVPYKHRVEAHVEGVGDVPMPVNLNTVNNLYNKNFKTEEEVRSFLGSIRLNISNPQNAREFLVNIYGESITELFFSRYTKKMWGLDLQQLPVSVVARIPVRLDSNPYYFNDRFQFMPVKGYHQLFFELLHHENIAIYLSTEFHRNMEDEYCHVFNSMPIDVYYELCFGELPYRSIIFEHRANESFDHSVPTVNFTHEDIYTRKTNWDLYPGCGGGKGNLITYEIPCDYKENAMERYYPVKTVNGVPQERYRLYREKSRQNLKTTFIGRCGQYVYYDMHQVVANSLVIANKFIERESFNK